jgi:hypothetical protein
VYSAIEFCRLLVRLQEVPGNLGRESCMMNTSVGRGAVVVLLVLVAACGSSGPTSPTGTNPPSAFLSPGQPPAKVFPPLSGPSRTFIFDRELSYPVKDYTRKSHFVLYDNGAFVLRFPSVGEGGYRGGYTDANGVITFEWEGWNVAGPWGATGTLIGNSLTVQYNEVMQFTDFESASYVLMP